MATLATFECDWIEALMMKSTFEEKKKQAQDLYFVNYMYMYI